MVQEVSSGKDQPINLSSSDAPPSGYGYSQPQPQYYSPYAQPQQLQAPVYSTTAQPLIITSSTHVQQGFVTYDQQQQQSDGSLIPCCSTSQRSFDLERAVFVRNVLLIVVAQLLIVAGMSSLFYFVDSIRIFMIEQAYWTWIIAFVAEIATLIILLVVRKNKGPAALFLFLFTLASGFFVATAVCYYELQVIIEAVVVTLGVTIVCVGYVVVTRADFRWLIIVILAISCTIMFWSFFFMFGFIYPSYYTLEWYWNLMTLAIILLFVCYLLFDMSLICNKYPTDEHILAAVNLYLDIITIFMYVLMLFGGKK